MRFIYACMFVSASLVALELIKNLKFTRDCIEITKRKIEILKKILDDYGTPR